MLPLSYKAMIASLVRVSSKEGLRGSFPQDIAIIMKSTLPSLWPYGHVIHELPPPPPPPKMKFLDGTLLLCLYVGSSPQNLFCSFEDHAKAVDMVILLFVHMLILSILSLRLLHSPMQLACSGTPKWTLLGPVNSVLIS